jgi:hypothetical protein
LKKKFTDKVRSIANLTLKSNRLKNRKININVVKNEITIEGKFISQDNKDLYYETVFNLKNSRFNKKNNTCTCPYSNLNEKEFCKHIVALGISTFTIIHNCETIYE